MEMRIVVPDAASASALAERLAVVLGAERIVVTAAPTPRPPATRLHRIGRR
jgi:hypothetical protein